MLSRIMELNGILQLIAGGDKKAIEHWWTTYNQHLQAIPAELVYEDSKKLKEYLLRILESGGHSA